MVLMGSESIDDNVCVCDTEVEVFDIKYGFL